MKILIKVTRDILRRSSLCKIEEAKINCAISLAIRDLFPFSFVFAHAIAFNEEAMVAYESNPFIRIMEGTGHLYLSRLPINAQNFINKFDGATEVERLYMPEFSFEIDVPNEVIDQIGIGQCYKVLSESKTLELVM